MEYKRSTGLRIQGSGTLSALVSWSGRPGSNRRRPAWENANSSFLKDIEAYGVHRVQWCFPSFANPGANGITTESRTPFYHHRFSSITPLPMMLVTLRLLLTWLNMLLRRLTPCLSFGIVGDSLSPCPGRSYRDPFENRRPIERGYRSFRQTFGRFR